MARKINTATTDEPWWSIDRLGMRINKMSSGRDGYPKTELMGKLHFMRFSSAKTELLAYIARETATAKAKVDGLSQRTKWVKSLKERDIGPSPITISPAPEPATDELKLGAGEVR
jgi:hypothetical protein